MALLLRRCTYASTVTVSGGVGAGGGLSYGYAVDGRGQIQKFYSYEGQGITGMSAFIGKGYSVSNATDIDTWFAYKSYGGDISASDVIAVSGGVRFGYDDTEKEAKYTEIDVSAGLGLPGVSGDVAVTTTRELGKKYELKKLWEACKSSLE